MWVGSGAGGSVAAARASGSTARSRWSIVWRNWRSGFASRVRPGRPGAAPGSPRSSRARRGALRQTRRRVTRTRACRPRERRQQVQGRAEVPGRRVQVAQDRPLRLGEVAQPAHVGAPARRGRPAARGSWRPAPRAGSLWSRPSGRPRARSGSRRPCAPSSAPITRSASTISESICLVWRPSTRSVLLVSRRPGRGAPDHVVEVVGPPRQPCAQLPHDQP